MKLVNILDVVKIANGSVDKFSGIKRYIATGDLSENIISSYSEVTYDNRPSRANVQVKFGQVIFARMKDTKKVLLIDDDNVDFIYSTGFCVFEPSKSILSDYLRVILNSDLFQNQKDKYSKGATQKAINNEGLKKIQIPLPPLETQKKIVEVLDKAQGLIDARKEQIRLMDELIQSVFYEMFGDPVTNSYDHPMMAFDKISDSRLGKMLDKKQITGAHLKKYLGNSNVRWFEFDLSDLKEMDFNERDREKFQLRKGDLIICEGGEIGRCAIWQEEVEDCFYQKALHRVRLNSKIVLPEYIQYVLWFYSKRGGFKDYGTSATISHLTGAKLKKMKVPIPPMEEQLKFENFLIKKQFEFDEIKKANELYQELYASLMNSYLNINGIGGS